MTVPQIARHGMMIIDTDVCVVITKQGGFVEFPNVFGNVNDSTEVLKSVRVVLLCPGRAVVVRRQVRANASNGA
jgi:hypothetical protein